jgi:hypothetical protein
MDAVEISTTAGHYIALDMRESPYPLGGEPRDVVEDVRRLGGFGIAAHPDSPKRELSWTQWDLPIDGLEIVNPDTAWRVHVAQPGLQPKLHLLRGLATYPFVPEETIASLLNDPSSIIARWQSLIASRPVVAVAGVDAHAKLVSRLPARFSNLVAARPSRRAVHRQCSGRCGGADARHSRRPSVHRDRRVRHAAVIRVQRVE